ncbi:hypothetical protein [Roseobacter sp. HKCCA0882]|uniref:hypothetical protein n=1 Tax=Roseobacter sp. HKCCA0882 TaxID=3120337 RepID=UPI0030EBFED2
MSKLKDVLLATDVFPEYSVPSVCGVSVIKVPARSKSKLAGKCVACVAHHKGNAVKGFIVDETNFSHWQELQNPLVTLEMLPNICDHIASPDIIYLEEMDLFVLSVHGKLRFSDDRARYGKQGTVLLTSTNGIDFRNSSDVFANAYSRIHIRTDKAVFLFEKFGAHHVKVGKLTNFPSSQSMSHLAYLTINNIRHFSVFDEGTNFKIFYTRIFDYPESIMVNEYSWNDFSLCSSHRLKMPFPNDLNLLSSFKSWPGMPLSPYYGCRDPFLFESDEKKYLIFSRNGEHAISVFDLAYGTFIPVKNDRFKVWRIQYMFGKFVRYLYWKFLKLKEVL